MAYRLVYGREPDSNWDAQPWTNTGLLIAIASNISLTVCTETLRFTQGLYIYGWLIRKTPTKIDDLGVPPFMETPIYLSILYNYYRMIRSHFKVDRRFPMTALDRGTFMLEAPLGAISRTSAQDT